MAQIKLMKLSQHAFNLLTSGGGGSTYFLEMFAADSELKRVHVRALHLLDSVGQLH